MYIDTQEQSSKKEKKKINLLKKKTKKYKNLHKNLNFLTKSINCLIISKKKEIFLLCSQFQQNCFPSTLIKMKITLYILNNKQLQ